MRVIRNIIPYYVISKTYYYRLQRNVLECPSIYINDKGISKGYAIFIFATIPSLAETNIQFSCDPLAVLTR